jgi:hypothetical protein
MMASARTAALDPESLMGAGIAGGVFRGACELTGGAITGAISV